MRRLLPVFLGILVLVGGWGNAGAASPKALSLRQAQGLVAFTPSEKFLAGNFVADETDPAFIFGPVQAFAASRKCPTTWLVEEGVKNRLASPASPEASVEYTLYLEEDCPDGVIYYVFMDQGGMTPQQWLEWRRQFHKSKAEETFGAAKSKLEKACAEGCGVSGELRFIQKNGELLPKSPEAFLRTEFKFSPIYDLTKQQKIAK